PLEPLMIFVDRVALGTEKLLQAAFVALHRVARGLLLLVVKAVVIDDAFAISVPFVQRRIQVEPIKSVGIPNQVLVKRRERPLGVAEKAGRKRLRIFQLGNAFGEKVNANADSQKHDRGGGQTTDTVR